MDQNPITPQNEQYEEIDLMELVRKLLKEWKRIFKWGAIAAVVGVFIAFCIPKVYVVNATLAPEVVSRASAGVSAIAAMSGINLGAQSTGDAVYPELYPEIVTSSPFITDLFSVEVDFKHKKEKMSADYYTYLKEYCRSPWWVAVVNAPFKALGWFLGLFREEVEQVEGYASLDPSALTKEQTKIAKIIAKSINLSVDKKTTVISLSVSAQDPYVAAKICQEVIDRLQAYVTSYRTEKSRKDLVYYQQLYDEAKAEYHKAQQAYASYVDANQGVVLQRVLTEGERLRQESQQSFSVYNTCTQQLQMAKAKVQQETPVCAVIKPPVRPLKQDHPSKMKMMIVFAFLGALGAAAWIGFGRDFIAKFKEGAREDSNTRSES